MVAHCRMTFKMKNECEKKRDVTLLFTYNHRSVKRIPETLLKHKEETCLDLSLATLESYPHEGKKVSDLNTVTKFFELMDSNQSGLYPVVLKEYLQLFYDDTHSRQRKTLVIFTWNVRLFEYSLQAAKAKICQYHTCISLCEKSFKLGTVSTTFEISRLPTV